MGFVRVAALVVLTAVAVKVLPGFFSSSPPLLYHETTEKGWERVGEVFREVLESQPNFGYAYSVYHEGKKVVDLYGGYADVGTLEPYRENTLTALFSSTKGLSALCVALLVDRGLLDYKKKVVDYWPEFGANGKESITVETLLSHQAGLFTISEGWSLFDILGNPEKISKQLAEQKPLWEPGTKHGYHSFTITMYMNELIKRVDPKHRRLDHFFNEEFVKPLGLDLFLGLPLSENYRVSRSDQTLFASIEDWSAFFFDDQWKVFYKFVTDSPFAKVIKDIKEPTQLMFTNPYVRQIPCGSYSGYGTARDSAKLMGIIANGGTYNGKTYLSPKTTKLLTEVLTSGEEYVMGMKDLQFGRGTSPFKTPLGNQMFGTPGAGGQMVYGDLEHKLGHAFLTNKMYNGLNPFSPQYKLLLKATYDTVEKIK